MSQALSETRASSSLHAGTWTDFASQPRRGALAAAFFLSLAVHAGMVQWLRLPSSGDAGSQSGAIAVILTKADAAEPGTIDPLPEQSAPVPLPEKPLRPETARPMPASPSVTPSPPQRAAAARSSAHPVRLEERHQTAPARATPKPTTTAPTAVASKARPNVETLPAAKRSRPPVPAPRRMRSPAAEKQADPVAPPLREVAPVKASSAAAASNATASELGASDLHALASAKPLPDNPPPKYPRAARKRREQGEVLLRLSVREDGRPDGLELLQSSGYPLLDRAALTAVADWRFSPARRGNQPIASTVEVPVIFRLDDGG